MIDWRGHPYTIGSTIFYPRMSGRSVEIQEGRVVDIWDAVYDLDRYKWVRYDPAKPVEFTGDPVTRVKVMPTGKGSRNFYRTGETYQRDASGELVFDDDGQVIIESLEFKAVTILNTENITVAVEMITQA